MQRDLGDHHTSLAMPLQHEIQWAWRSLVEGILRLGTQYCMPDQQHSAQLFHEPRIVGGCFLGRKQLRARYRHMFL